MSDRLARKNHSVPEAYLRGWARSDGRVLSYRLLVPHERYPEWEPRSPSRLTRYTDLYTSSYSGTDSDDFERWMNEEVEEPAAVSLAKVRADVPLDQADWSRLATYAAALDLRTPVSYLEHAERWARTVPETLQKTMKELPDRLLQAARTGELAKTARETPSHRFPLKVSLVPHEGGTAIRAEIVMGREMWISEQRRLLTSTADVWTKHRWSILAPHPGSEWFTSDHPVVRLNYYGDDHYDFKGGWGNPGTELVVPLSPRHLMYTKIGSEWEGPPTTSVDQTYLMQKFIAERAHRWIFATGPARRPVWFHPRRVDREAFQSEVQAWQAWHQVQRSAEQGPAKELGPL